MSCSIAHISSIPCRRASRPRLCLSRAQPESQGQPHSHTSPAHIVQRNEKKRARSDAAVDTSQAVQSVSIAAVSLLAFAFAGAAQAGEGVPAELSGLLNSWLDALQALGPLGPVAFVATIGICECIPFFPSQPLSICAGLLFGAGSGAALNLLGLCIASTLAFTLSRTVGRPLAQAVIEAETGGKDGQNNGDQASQNPVAAQIEKAQTAIENGGPLQQFTAILLLRMTPIVPFSASNYVLGLTPVPYGPFIGATVAGMSVWSVLLASLGGAGRELLTSGEDLSDAIAQVSAEAGEMTGGVFAVAAALGVGVLALNKIAPIILPSPDDLGKPEAEAEAKRLAALEATVGNPRKSGEEEEDEAEKDTVFAAVHSTRKR